VHSSHEDQSFRTAHDRSGGGPVQHPGAAIPPNDPTGMFPWEASGLASEDGYPDDIESVDPFAQLAAGAVPGAPGQRPPVRRAKGKSRSGQEPGAPRFGRRKLVTLLAAGTVGAITVVTVGGISLARSPEQGGHTGDGGSISTVPQKERDKEKAGRGHGTGDGERDGEGDGEGKRPHKKPTPSPTQTQTPSPTKTPSPTSTPQPTVTPPTATPSPKGTVIGSTTQATNTAVAFTNPADGQASWLVHMSNGNFVAVEGACTHAGVAVKYNASLGQFTCPAHGAIFNADGTNPQAPAKTPLPPVHITVNANGTITTP
jgi:Rieske Fe-S protein